MDVLELLFAQCFGPSIKPQVSSLPPVTLDTRYMSEYYKDSVAFDLHLDIHLFR